MLSARSPKYPALYDEESGVRFRRGRAEVTEKQAHLLAKRRFVDGILIGEFDELGLPVNEQPAKDWAKAQRREAEPGDTSGTEEATVQPDDATGQGRRRATK